MMGRKKTDCRQQSVMFHTHPIGFLPYGCPDRHCTPWVPGLHWHPRMETLGAAMSVISGAILGAS